MSALSTRLVLYKGRLEFSPRLQTDTKPYSLRKDFSFGSDPCEEEDDAVPTASLSVPSDFARSGRLGPAFLGFIRHTLVPKPGIRGTSRRAFDSAAATRHVRPGLLHGSLSRTPCPRLLPIMARAQADPRLATPPHPLEHLKRYRRGLREKITGLIAAIDALLQDLDPPVIPLHEDRPIQRQADRDTVPRCCNSRKPNR